MIIILPLRPSSRVRAVPEIEPYRKGKEGRGNLLDQNLAFIEESYKMDHHLLDLDFVHCV